MLKLITEISLLIILAYAATELSYMPKWFLTEKRAIKKALGSDNSSKALR